MLREVYIVHKAPLARYTEATSARVRSVAGGITAIAAGFPVLPAGDMTLVVEVAGSVGSGMVIDAELGTGGDVGAILTTVLGTSLGVSNDLRRSLEARIP